MITTQDIQADIILPDLEAANKKQVFDAMAKEIFLHTQLDSKNIVDHLLNREKSDMSGIGEGIAIPHLQLDQIKNPLTVFCTLKNKINFETVDQLPVDLVFLLLSPKSDGPVHLRRLSRISRFFRDNTICEKLRTAKDAHTIRSVLFDPQGWLHAA